MELIVPFGAIVMELGVPVVILLRLIVPLSIFRYHFWGTVASVILDGIDVVIADALGATRGLDYGIGSYVRGDKLFDMYYLSIAFYTSLKWGNALAKGTSIFLYVYRAVGVLLFEITQTRLILFIFPNLFENWFLFWAARNSYFPNFKLTAKKLIMILLILSVPKLSQEYLLHFMEAHPWDWIKSKFGLG